MEKEFWNPKSGRHVNDAHAVFGNSTRLDPKRNRQWLLDTSETELFPAKKQSWEGSAGFPSVQSQFMDRLLGSETTGPVTLTDRRMPIDMANDTNMRKTVANDQFQSDSSVGLSISYAMEDIEAGVSYGGLRKVKVNQVKEPSSENGIGISMDQTYGRASDSNFGQPCHSYDIGEANIFKKNIDNTILMTQSYNKGENHTLSFAGYQDDSVLEALDRPMGSFTLLYDQSSDQTSETPIRKEADDPKAGANASTSQAPKTKLDCVSKNKLEIKPTRKEAPNSFPSNVRSLIATGILDGVPIRYVSVSREELRGIIKGCGYLCGCETCNYSKAVNAYEFERHAGSKTKHPNNHIYFENGKTIYQIVQELRTTPHSLLFDAIQTVTGSPINQKAFRIWKESFQAASREIQRIYGKEELNL